VGQAACPSSPASAETFHELDGYAPQPVVQEFQDLICYIPWNPAVERLGDAAGDGAQSVAVPADGYDLQIIQMLKSCASRTVFAIRYQL